MKAKYIIFTLITIIAILLLCIPNVQASGYSNNIVDWTFDAPQLPVKLAELAGVIIKLLRNLSIIITIIVITILGVKYMLGSVEEKADYKKDYVNIIIGSVLISLTFSIVNVIFTIVDGIV